jgi:hypothetical protein
MSADVVIWTSKSAVWGVHVAVIVCTLPGPMLLGVPFGVGDCEAEAVTVTVTVGPGTLT